MDNSDCDAEDATWGIKKYRRNPFINNKEDYFNEHVERIICSILANKNIKKINYLTFDVLFNFFIKIIKRFGSICKKFSSLRGSVVVNYIDIKYCLRLYFNNIYKEIYIIKNYKNNFDHIIFNINIQNRDEKIINHQENEEKGNYINVIQNSYLYYQNLCTKKKNNNFNSDNSFSQINTDNLHNSPSNQNVNVLSLDENIDIEKYKELMRLKKKYMHDHMPIVPLTLNRKEKITGYYNEQNELHNQNSFSFFNSTDQSSSELSDTDSNSIDQSHNLDTLENVQIYNNDNNNSGKNSNDNLIYEKEIMCKEKIEVLKLIPKIKDIYIQNSSQQNSQFNTPNDKHPISFNSNKYIEPQEYQNGLSLGDTPSQVSNQIH
ncbi:conserved Plasmodium protein, unknown function [Plasmodium yoelii]|uniref:Uncharacterized protein n=2 Tax=Plasmodium yoelii TaxID=5861 RepID=A0AAE9WY31_PLAYO|nr:conserved Plasmodium protein, unknown function [Plasmodium yoelii]WBY58538.1 hypothetical protein Py17XNL_001105560 [Plasmodium yoelii yoelii]CDU18848.1 conserved Plasmodium protein, unknown function [Plasmodium yoelii]VTZ79433.1 conserved Plasmodium protein, unknown function [Plasmodium yoelii]|eukprot:XP_731217.2 conserved Plasmodium protein, unknown function [Plasmodium yoelii]